MSDIKNYKTYEVGYNLYVDYSDDTDPINRRGTMEMTALTAQEAHDDACILWEENDMAFFDDDDELGGISSLEIDIDSSDDIREVYNNND